jgi:hypothetical protein
MSEKTTLISSEVLEFEPIKLPEPGKLQQILRSRRFWTVVLSIAATIAVEVCGFNAGQVERINQVIMVVAGVYIGGLSLEDAVKQISASHPLGVGGLDKILSVLPELLSKKQ